jgi:hypothetical protein
MKTSNKILLGTAIGIFVSLPIIMGISTINNKAHATSSKITQTSDFKNFQKLIIKGTWESKIIRGDEYRVTVSADHISSSQFSAFQKEDTVTLSNVGASNQDHYTVTIVMPKLYYLEMRGTIHTTLSQFHEENLSLILNGTHSLKGEDNEIENLNLSATGTSSIDLSRTKTINVDLNIAGTNSTQLNMQGGNLTGQAKGAVSISYRGTVKSQQITTSGVAKVDKINDTI